MSNDRRFQQRLYLWLTVLCIFALVVSCGDDKGTSPNTSMTDINSYLSKLPSWDDFASVSDTCDAPAGEMVADMSGQVLCTSTPYSITQNPEEIVTFGSAPNVLYLGSLIQGNTYMGGLGSMEELPIRQRAPLVIAVNLFSGTDIMDTVADPNGASVQAALNTLISNASSGHQSGNRVYYNKTETYSLRQATLKLGMSFKYMGVSAQSQLGYSATDQQHTITAYFKQIMYEAYIVPPQTPAQFFTSAFTTQKLDEQINLGNIGDNNLPVYVGRIQYGRMMMFTMTSTAHTDSMMMAIEGSYSGFQNYSAQVEASLRNVLQTSTYTIVTIGGASATALSMLKSGSLADYFVSDDPITTAVPLAYTLYNLADGSIAVVSETTDYDIEQCSSVNAQCYLNKTEWQMAVAQMAGPGHIVEFLTTADNIALSNEYPNVPGPNTNLGNIITFDSSVTHYPFTFSLKASVSGYRLVYDDQEGGGSAWGSMDHDRSIGVGSIGSQEDDNFEVRIPEWDSHAAVFAIGITVGNNVAQSGEAITTYGVNSFGLQFNMSPDCPGQCGFIGIVATIPVTELFFNEANTSNNIFVRDFCFGVLQW